MMVKINQMKKDELFEGFWLIKSSRNCVKRRREKLLCLPVEIEIFNRKVNYGGCPTWLGAWSCSGRREVYNTPQVNQLTCLPQTRRAQQQTLRKKPPVDPKIAWIPVKHDFQIENPVTIWEIWEGFIISQLLNIPALKQVLLITATMVHLANSIPVIPISVE